MINLKVLNAIERNKKSSNWRQLPLQRAFFDNLAQQLAIRSPEDWNSITLQQVKAKGASPIISLYKGSLKRGYINSISNDNKLYVPYIQKFNGRGYETMKNIQVTFSTFTIITHWRNLHTQKEFFDNLAKELKITTPNDWYKVTLEQVFERGGRSVLRDYKFSLISGMISE